MKRIFIAFTSLLLVSCASAPAERSPAADHKYAGRDNAIGLMINDMLADDNDLKTADQIEKYHRCLLSGKHEARQSQSYLGSYRHFIAVANESFNVPVAMLTCLCGRESRFDARNESDESSAKGICQALNESLADVKRWVATVPALRRDWEGYVTRLGARLEHPDCANAPLSHDLLMRCPSLGLGVASVYLKYVYSRVERAPLADSGFRMQGIPTLVGVAGSYYAGPGLAGRALERTRTRADWRRALPREVCLDAEARGKPREWTARRLNILRNHMTAVRNCMQAGNWLDHQGQPLRGECAPADAPKQLRELEAFRASIPVTCEGW